MRDRVIALTISALLFLTCFAPTLSDFELGRVGTFSRVDRAFPKEAPRLLDWEYDGSMTVDQITAVLGHRLVGYPRVLARQLASHLMDEARRYGFSPALVLSVINAESGFNVDAESPRGAKGLMQVMPKTAAYIAARVGVRFRNEAELHNPFKNISLGTAYLAHLRDRYENELKHFIGAYNAGPGRMNRVLRGRSRKPKETIDYIERVKSALPYMKQYGLTRATEVVSVGISSL